MRVERLFSSVPLRPASGVYDSGGADGTAGALAALRLTADANRRSAGRIGAAQERHTGALVRHGEARKRFGRTIGASLETLGKTLHDRAVARRQYSDAANHTLDLLRQSAAALEDARRATAPDGNGLSAHYAQRQLDLLRRKTEDIVDPEVRRSVEERFLQSIEVDRAEVRIEELRRGSAYQRAQLAGRVAAYTERAVARSDPRRQVPDLEQIAADLETSVATGLLTRQEAGLRLHAATTLVRDRTIESWSRSDPDRTAALFADGAFDHLFASDDEKQDTEKLLASAVAGLAFDGIRAAALQQRLARDRQARLAGAPGDASLAGDLQAQGTAAQRRTFRDAARMATLQRDMQRQIRFQPWSKVGGLLPVDGRSSAPRELAARTAVLRDAREWAEDPAAIAALHPLGSSHLGRLAVQEAKGIPAPAWFTRAEAAEWTARHAAAAPAQRRMLEGRLREEAGPHLDAVLRDLSAGGLPLSSRLRLLHGGGPAPAGFWERIEAAEAASMADLQFHDGGAVLEAIDAALSPALDPYLDTLEPALEGAGHDRLRDGYVALARKLALLFARSGASPAAAVRRTVAELFGERYVLLAGTRVPRRFDAPAVAAHMAEQRARPLDDFAPDPVETGATLADGETPEAWRRRIAVEGRFATRPDDRGMVLLTADGLPVRNAEGRRFGIEFEEVPPAVEGSDGGDAGGPAFDQFRRRLLWSLQAGPAAMPPSAAAA